LRPCFSDIARSDKTNRCVCYSILELLPF